MINFVIRGEGVAKGGVRHMELRMWYVRGEQYQKKGNIIILNYMPGEIIPTDKLTKLGTTEEHKIFRDNMLGLNLLDNIDQNDENVINRSSLDFGKIYADKEAPHHQPEFGGNNYFRNSLVVTSRKENYTVEDPKEHYNNPSETSDLSNSFNYSFGDQILNQIIYLNNPCGKDIVNEKHNESINETLRTSEITIAKDQIVDELTNIQDGLYHHDIDATLHLKVSNLDEADCVDVLMQGIEKKTPIFSAIIHNENQTSSVFDEIDDSLHNKEHCIDMAIANITIGHNSKEIIKSDETNNSLFSYLSSPIKDYLDHKFGV
eukprot:gene14340-19232_t